jgi:hypothetical protein
MCLHRGIEFLLDAFFLLRQQRLIATTASALNQPCRRRALEKRQIRNSYRVLKHGTYAKTALPSFHTPMSGFSGSQPSGSRVSRIESATALRCTQSPSYRTPVHRTVGHKATVHPYTKERPNTVISYTGISPKSSKRLSFPADNCTKLRSKLYNRRVDAFGVKRGGAS